MALPKEPRQKMINLMYLVLTALLALNVSSEIINAFKTIDNSLVAANAVIKDKNETVYKTFQKSVEDPKTKDKALIWQPKALAAKKLSEDVYGYLEALKLELKKEAGLEMREGKESFKEDNLEAATRLLVEGPKGKELLQKLTDFKTNLVNILNPNEFGAAGMEEIKKRVQAAKDGFATSLPLDLAPPKGVSEANKDWNAAYFRMTPTVAAITMLSKFQNDVKNSESQIVDFCLKQVSEVVLEYDQFQAIASQSSEYLMPDQEMTITGGVGAFSKAAAPNVSVDGAGVPLNAQGVAEYKFKVGGPGTYSKKVRITFKKPDGTDGSVEKELKYTVGSPTGASVSADAVKVLYIGLKNPLTITGGTAGAEKTSASIDNGTLTNQGGGKFVAEVNNPGEANINVSVDGKSGGAFKFKVKRVPNPTPIVGNLEPGRVAANAIKGQVGLRAELKDFVFEGVTFNVTSFTLIANGGSCFTNLGFSPNPGAYFNEESKRLLNKSCPGASIILDEIKAVGPGGDTRKLPPIVYNLY